MNTETLGEELKKLGFNFFSGVPCSYLSSLINYAINEVTFIMSANEGDAVATCAGAHLAGQKSVLLIQNSGLTNAASPLTSLNYCFKIPLLGFVSLRGEAINKDEPQHELMGASTEKMLELINIKWEYLSENINEMKDQLVRASNYIENNEIFFFIVKKGILEKIELKKQKRTIRSNFLKTKKLKEDRLPLRREVLQTISSCKKDDCILLTTTGKSGREMYEISDSCHNLYMVGSMGCISSLGLGLATAQPRKKVIAIDGDGALLMRMGNLATNGYYSPNNLLHILIDNNIHDSTGGQFTAACNVDFVEVAANCSYPNSFYSHSLSELEKYIVEWYERPVLTFVYIKIRKGTKPNLGRPKIKPFEVKTRLMEFING